MFMSKSKWKHPNAQKHAVFSKILITQDEDPAEFQQLLDDLAEEWRPDGPAEEDAVLDLAKAFWRKRRLQKYLTFEGQKNQRNPDHQSYDERVGLTMFMVFLELTDQITPKEIFHYGANYLRKDQIDHFRDKFQPEKFESTSEWAKAILEEINSRWLPMYTNLYSIDSLTSVKSAATFWGDLFEREIALDERLNGMIDRVVKRLVHIKTMKQILGRARNEPKGDVIRLPLQTPPTVE
jgi:hypothetical protein